MLRIPYWDPPCMIDLNKIKNKQINTGYDNAVQDLTNVKNSFIILLPRKLLQEKQERS